MIKVAAGARQPGRRLFAGAERARALGNKICARRVGLAGESRPTWSTDFTFSYFPAAPRPRQSAPPEMAALWGRCEGPLGVRPSESLGASRWRRWEPLAWAHKFTIFQAPDLGGASLGSELSRAGRGSNIRLPMRVAGWARA